MDQPILNHQRADRVHTVIAQERLIELGYNLRKADGNYDLNMARHVIEFQESKKLVADGVIGEKTWAKLISAPKAEKETAKKEPAKKAPAKKEPAKSTAKKAPAKKAPAKKAPAKKK
tara:strand:+ start:811 stop:1161 length:351 start_codon:yes stop_codon:yes gene_type:complete